MIAVLSCIDLGRDTNRIAEARTRRERPHANRQDIAPSRPGRVVLPVIFCPKYQITSDNARVFVKIKIIKSIDRVNTEC